MKELFTEQEYEKLRESHHGGLKFIVFSDDTKLIQCYRVTVSGGLDYCNNQVDKMNDSMDKIITVKIYDRKGNRNWREIAYLQRTLETKFNH